MNFLLVNRLLRKCNICPIKLINNDNPFYNKLTHILKNINLDQVGGDYKINLGANDYITMHKRFKSDYVSIFNQDQNNQGLPIKRKELFLE